MNMLFVKQKLNILLQPDIGQIPASLWVFYKLNTNCRKPTYELITPLVSSGLLVEVCPEGFYQSFFEDFCAKTLCAEAL